MPQLQDSDARGAARLTFLANRPQLPFLEKP